MFAGNTRRKLFVAGVTSTVCIGLVLAGCVASGRRRHTPSTRPADPPGEVPAGARAGEKIFASHGCQACHTIGSQGGTIGPNLSDEGEKGHSREWLTEQLRDPKAHDPATLMPSYASLSQEELSDLVDYLRSLSGGVIVARPQAETAPATQPQEAASAAKPGKSGAVLWTENCGRCHNYRAPTEFTDAQWAVVVHHMRLRVPLTGQEQRAILKFLQDSN